MNAFFNFRVFLLLISAAIFILVSSSQFLPKREEVELPDFSKIQLKPKPIGNLPPPEISAQSVLVVDAATDTVLFEKNPNLKTPPASLTKLATALVVLEKCSKDLVITVPKIATPAGTIMGLVEGEQIIVESLLYGLLLPSGNDAANVLVLRCFGNFEEFLSSMTNLTQKLSMENTQFKNPSGLPAKGHFSTAHDLTKLAKAALSNPEISEIIRIKEKVVTDLTGKISHKLTNLNKLLNNPQVSGIKTGRTSFGENLIAAKENEGHKIISVVLQSQDRFSDTERIFDWVFKNFVWEPEI